MTIDQEILQSLDSIAWFIDCGNKNSVDCKNKNSIKRDNKNSVDSSITKFVDHKICQSWDSLIVKNENFVDSSIARFNDCKKWSMHRPTKKASRISDLKINKSVCLLLHKDVHASKILVSNILSLSFFQKKWILTAEDAGGLHLPK